MERKVIDLEIIDEMEESGTKKISLVDSPAIEKNWEFFNKQYQFVEPKSGESESDYMGRCVPTLINEGKDQDQAVAICISTYQNMASEKFAKVSFDFDDTLSTEAGLVLAKKYKDEGNTLYIISARNGVSSGMLDRASELEIPADRVFATGSNKAKVAKVAELGIEKHIDNNADVIAELGVIGVKFEINTGGLAPYTDQTGPLKRKAVLATVEELAVGDEVSWKTADQNPRGKITEIVKGAKTVPGTDFEIKGTEEDPGYIIEIYEELEGKWNPTGKYVGRKADSILKNVQLASETDFSAILEFAKTAGFADADFTGNGMEFNEITENFDLKFAKGYTVYKYTGSVGSDTRDFCRDMVSLDRFYTFEEIDAMGAMAVNPGFGLNGAATYDIWKYKGGPNCKHRWTKFYVTEAGKYQNKGAAPGIAGEKPNDMSNHGYAFASVEDKREIVGAVAIPDIEIFRKDKEGNPYYVRFSKDVIRRMAEKFVREQRISETNIQHGNQDANTYIFESWIVEHMEDKANSVYKLNVPIGTWMVKARVLNDATWQDVKSGKLKGWSLEGDFVSKEEYEEYMENKKRYEDLVRLVSSL